MAIYNNNQRSLLERLDAALIALGGMPQTGGGSHGVYSGFWKKTFAKLDAIIAAIEAGGGGGDGIAVINQPAYTNAALKPLLDQSASLQTANYFVCNASSVWTFNDVSKVFTIKSLDGASRIEGDGTSVKIYYQREQLGHITADGGTYQFAGPALFRGLDGYIGDITAITLTQNAFNSSVRDLAATLANLYGWTRRQIDELFSHASGYINKVKLGALDELAAESNAVTIPFVDAEVTYHDPFDLGQFETEAQLPTPAPSNAQYYAGVTEGAGVKKYTSAFSANADTRLNPPQCFETDNAPSELANTFNELRIGTNNGQPVTVAQYNEWCAANAYDAGKMMQVSITKNAQYPPGSSISRIAIEAAYFKGNPRMTLYVGSNAAGIFASNTGDYVFGGVNQVIDMSGEPGWDAGDMVHLDGAAGKVWAEDANENRIPLRCAVWAGSEEMAIWPAETGSITWDLARGA